MAGQLCSLLQVLLVNFTAEGRPRKGLAPVVERITHSMNENTYEKAVVNLLRLRGPCP